MIKTLIFVAIAIYLAFAVFMYYGIGQIAKNDLTLLHHGELVTGRVNDIQTVQTNASKEGTSQPDYRIKINYTVQDESYTYNLRTKATSAKKYTLGQELHLVYHPDDPNNVSLAGQINEGAIRKAQRRNYTVLTIILGIIAVIAFPKVKTRLTE